MLRKKNEFKPDRTDSGTLSKLYITKKQRLSLLKWFLIGVCLLALSLLQDVVMSRFRIFGATTDLVPLLIFTVCILQGGESSCIFALVAAMVYYFSGSAPGPYCIILITFLAVLAAIFRQAYLRKGFSALMLCSILCMFLYEIGVFLIGLFLNQTYSQRFVLSALWTLFCVPVVYPIALSIGKIGGETWKE